jgi:hypothetical protein
LALTPEVFGRLTPGEFEWLCRGWTWRRERLLDTVAIVASFLVNRMGMAKEATRPDMLLDLFGDRSLGQSRVPGYRST